MIYLDYNSTSLVRPEVKGAMIEAMEYDGNPSSVHAYGRKALNVLQKARKKLADYINCDLEQLIFTSCGTESNIMVLKGVDAKQIITSTGEHPSVHQTTAGSIRVPIDRNGILDLALLEAALEQSEGRSLVSLIWSNNETGVIQPLKEIVALVKKYDALIHIDAVQCFGKMPIDFEALDIDFMTIAAHKVGGPIGVAALVIKDKKHIAPLFEGGGQEFGMRSGTENIIMIHAFAALVDVLEQKQEHEWAQYNEFRLFLENDIKNFCQKYKLEMPQFIGSAVERVPNISNITMPGVTSQQQLIEFDMSQIAVSSGSACSSGKVKISRIIKAMSFSEKEAETAIRVSFGWNTKMEDIKAYCECWKTIYSRAIKNDEQKTVEL